MVEPEARPPVGGMKQSLNSTGQVNKEVAHEEEPEQRQRQRRSWLEFPSRLPVLLRTHAHGQDGSHGIDGSDEDADLTDHNCEQQPPGGLTVGLPLTEDLRQPDAEEETADEGQTHQLTRTRHLAVVAFSLSPHLFSINT